MTIAEKLTAIAENEQRVYDAGKSAEWNAYWDDCQQNGSRTNYERAFCDSPLTANTFKPKYDMHCETAKNMFAHIGRFYSFENPLADLKTHLENLGVEIDTSQATALEGMFYLNTIVTHVPVISAENCDSLSTMFFSAGALREIEKIILKSDGNNTFPSTFDWCGNLKEIRFEGIIGNNIAFASSPLSKESITSLVNALSTTTSGKTLTLNKSAKEREFTSSEWDTLISAKSNWTISLV